MGCLWLNMHGIKSVRIMFADVSSKGVLRYRLPLPLHWCIVVQEKCGVECGLWGGGGGC